jgi:hypothetical protein
MNIKWFEQFIRHDLLNSLLLLLAFILIWQFQSDELIFLFILHKQLNQHGASAMFWWGILVNREHFLICLNPHFFQPSLDIVTFSYTSPHPKNLLPQKLSPKLPRLPSPKIGGILDRVGRDYVMSFIK